MEGGELVDWPDLLEELEVAPGVDGGDDHGDGGNNGGGGGGGGGDGEDEDYPDLLSDSSGYEEEMDDDECQYKIPQDIHEDGDSDDDEADGIVADGVYPIPWVDPSKEVPIIFLDDSDEDDSDIEGMQAI